MSWVRLDDSFSDHPKILKVGALGLALQVRALCYCARLLTDGKIMAAAINLLVQPLAVYLIDPETPMDDGLRSASRDLPMRMVEAGLWHIIPGGWQIHDYTRYNPSKREVARMRREKSRAGKAGAQARWQGHSTRHSTRMAGRNATTMLPSLSLNNNKSTTTTRSEPGPIVPSAPSNNGHDPREYTTTLAVLQAVDAQHITQAQGSARLRELGKAGR